MEKMGAASASPEDNLAIHSIRLLAIAWKLGDNA